MLEVELDVFSGMPNPTWVLSEREEKALLDRVEPDTGSLSPVQAADEQFSLGYRGLIVRQVKPDGGPWAAALAARGARALPGEFRVGSKPASVPIAEWLMGTSEDRNRRSLVPDILREVAAAGVTLVEPVARAFDPAVLEGLAPGQPLPADLELPPATGRGAQAPADYIASGAAAPRGVTWWDCGSNYFSANAQYFNAPEHVTRNNCYCFASNHLSGVRYARPGRRGGQPATSIDCAGVTAGLHADGWQNGCQPNGLTIVLVIWPGLDYHFYRLVTGRPYWWWGHKPGGTPAKYSDDCGNALYQFNGRGYAPNNCCRGQYTHFCGYFYQNNATAFCA